MHPWKGKLSLFDLDHTLLTTNSSFQFGAYLYKRGDLPLFTMLILVWFYFLHAMGYLSVGELHHKVASRYFIGMPVTLVEERADVFVKEHISHFFYAPAVERLRLAQTSNHYTVILSTSPDFLVKSIAKHFHVDDWGATRYSCNDEKKICAVTSVMTGVDKSDYVTNLASRFSVDRCDITAYSDSHLDLAFLEAAGEAIAVNPDRKLRALSRQRNWTII